MARPLRIDFPDALHHVIVRGNNKEKIFSSNEDKDYYLEKLFHYANIYEIELCNFK